MLFCKKCGKIINEFDKFCGGCGVSLDEAIKKKNSKNKIIIPIMIVVVLVVIFLIFMNQNNKITGDATQNEAGTFVEEECPYDCCFNDNNFKDMKCASDYECKSNKCIEIDSDNDGLTDLNEKEIGTNPNLFDTDGDSLGDYLEYSSMKTNPLSKNTDNDRYNDADDSNPLELNSAKIEISTLSKEWNWNYVNIIIAIVGGGIVNPDLDIAEPTIALSIKNVGNDYTNYLDFEILFQLQNTELEKLDASLNRLNIGESKIETYSISIKAGDIPSMLLNLVAEQSTDWDIKIINIDYENF
jgi:hypothetical protein